MPIRKLSKSKRLTKSKRAYKTTKLSKSKRLTKSNKKLKNKLKSRKNKSTNKHNRNHNRKHNHNHRGGFFGSSNCNIATVKEPGFNLAALGSGSTKIPGFAIPDQKAIIYDPHCKSDLYQAMVP